MSARHSLVCLATLAAIFPISSATAQVNIEWRRYHDDTTITTEERSLALAVDASGNVYVAGSVRDDTGPPGIFDPLVVKYDAAGQLLWSQRDLSVASSERAVALALDGSGGIVVVASSQYNQNGDFRVLRYDSAGALTWSSVPYDFAGLDDVVEATKLLIDPQGNIFVAASSRGATFDGVLVSYDSAGALRWATRIDGIGAGASEDGFADLCFDGQGGVLVGGFTSNQEESLVARIDGAGNVLWLTHFQMVPGLLHKIVALARDGGMVYAAGYGPEIGGIGSGSDCGWLHQLDVGTGQVQWSVARPRTTWFDLQLLGSGVVATGRRYLFGVDTSVNMLTERFAADGSSVWQRAWNNSYNYDDTGLRVLVDPSGDVLVAGVSRATGGYGYPQPLVCLRYAADGTLRWSLSVDEPEAATCALGGAALAPDGSVLLTGMKVKVLGTPIEPPDIETVKLRPQSVVYCAGDGSSGPCPCGNNSPALSQRGCLNSTGQSANLADFGHATIGADSLALTATGELPNALSIFLQGSTFPAALPFGDGLRCVGGTLRRLYAHSASLGFVTAPIAGDLHVSARSASLGDPLAPGAQRGYQVYYRDPDPSFCPAPAGSGFNVTNALRVTWGG